MIFFDISKLRNSGQKLSYIPPQNVNDIQITSLELDYIKSKIEYWEFVIYMVCYVLGAFPIWSAYGFIRLIWGSYGIDKVLVLKNGVVIV